MEALIESGTDLGVDPFFLIQWIAPLASESPEIIVAILFSLRLNPAEGLTTLVSAQVNQLTLLIGSMTVVFSISAGDLLNFPLDSRQSIEFFLTSAMSAFAVLLIVSRVVSWRVGLILLALFLTQLVFSGTTSRLLFGYIFLFLAGGLLVFHRRHIWNLVRPHD